MRGDLGPAARPSAETAAVGDKLDAGERNRVAARQGRTRPVRGERHGTSFVVDHPDDLDLHGQPRIDVADRKIGPLSSHP